MSGFFKTIWGIIVALARLIVLEFILFFNGLNHILFNKSEIVSVSITIAPQRQEREKLSYLDNLKLCNFDIDNNISVPQDNYIEFRGDDEFDGEDFDDDDLEDFDDDDKGTSK